MKDKEDNGVRPVTMPAPGTQRRVDMLTPKNKSNYKIEQEDLNAYFFLKNELEKCARDIFDRLDAGAAVEEGVHIVYIEETWAGCNKVRRLVAK